MFFNRAITKSDIAGLLKFDEPPLIFSAAEYARLFSTKFQFTRACRALGTLL